MTLLDIFKDILAQEESCLVPNKTAKSFHQIILLLTVKSRTITYTMGCAVSTAVIETSLGKDCGPPVSLSVQYSQYSWSGEVQKMEGGNGRTDSSMH